MAKYWLSITLLLFVGSLEVNSQESTTNEPDTEATTDADNVETTADPWQMPIAWTSEKLYPFGADEGDSVKQTGAQQSTDTYAVYYDWWYCQTVPINQPFGFRCQGTIYNTINICSNGMVQIGSNWLFSVPYGHGTRSYLQYYCVIGAFWGYTDPFTLEEHSASIGEDKARTKVYYQEYTSGSVIERAQDDTIEANKTLFGGSIPSDFTPTSVMVVTAVNMPPNKDHCFQYGTIRKYYEYATGRSSSTYYQGRLDYYTEKSDGCVDKIAAAPKNTFQTIMITNGSYSLVQYVYPEGGIEWVHPNVDEYSDEDILKYYAATGSSSYANLYVATGGVTTPKNNFEESTYANKEKSGTLQFVNADSEMGNMGRIGVWMNRTDNFDGSLNYREICLQWSASLDADNQEALEEFSTDYSCAGTWWDVIWDSRFRFYSYNRQTRAVCYERRRAFGDDRQFRALCCYSFNWLQSGYLNLITDPFRGAGYTMDIANAEDEGDAYTACCREAIQLCRNEFYANRFPPTTTGFVPVRRRAFRGDPHLTSIDGVDYSFNGHGEYLLFGTNENGTMVQARTARVLDAQGAPGEATYFSAAAVQFRSLGVIHVQVNNDSVSTDPFVTLDMYFNGSMVDFTTLVNDNSTQTLDGVDMNYNFDKSNNSLLIVCPDGTSVNISVSLGYMSIALSVTSDYINGTSGLLGYFDEDPVNDLMHADGTYIENNSTSSDIFTWGQTWAVAEADSILYYPEGTTQADFVNLTFTPIFGEDTLSLTWSSEDLKTSAIATCGDNAECLFDVYSTGNLAVGEQTKAVGEEAAAISTSLANTPPMIEGIAEITISIGVPYTFNITVTDNTIATVNVTALPAGEVVIDTTSIASDGIVNINITIDAATNLTAFEFVIQAVDELGKSAVYQPKVLVCGCQNDAVCGSLSATQIAETLTPSFLNPCECTEGWTGDFCEADLDACALAADVCFPGVLCIDDPAPAGANDFTCGDCPTGYEGDGKFCDDINECTSDDTNDCTQNCFNVPGSYGCLCDTGYSLNADGVTCDDVDECAANVCHQVCENTNGSFVCSCESEIWELSSDSINCEPANPCDASNSCDKRSDIGFCSQDAVSGDQTCLCARGYELESNMLNCTDIDECALNDPVCADMCNNTEGGFECSCSDGYLLNTNGVDCDDYNECANGEYSCDVGGLCVNTDGSYDCACPTGSTSQNGVCVVASTDEPVPATTNPTSDDQLAVSIKLTFADYTAAEYTVAKERQLYSLVAANLTAYCADRASECGAVDDGARRKRAIVAPVYTASMIMTVQGYPTETGIGLEIAFYVNHPDVGYATVAILETVTTTNIAEMEALFGGATMTVAAVAPPTSATTAVPSTSDTLSQGAIIGIAVGCSLVGLALVIIIIIIIVKKKEGQKVTQDPEETEQPQRRHEQTQPQHQETQPQHQETQPQHQQTQQQPQSETAPRTGSAGSQRHEHQ